MPSHCQPSSLASARSLFSTAILMLVAVAAFLAITMPSTANAEVHEISEGELNWGIKESWRNYVGGGFVSEGAAVNEDSTFKFPLESGTFDDETNTTVLNFQGKVWFRAWWEFTNPGQWALDDTFYDFQVVISPTQQVIRASHIGYSQSDPGGELHVFENGVVGKIQVDDGEFTSAEGQTGWNEFRTLAGPDLGLYSEGAVIDRVSFNYAGPGGIPDTGEKWDQPGSIGMTARERVITDYPRENWTASNRDLFVSEDGESVHFAEIKTANSNVVGAAELRISKLDPETLEQIGDATVFPLKHPVGNNAWGRYFRFAHDPVSDDLFFILAGRGEDHLGTWVMAAGWDDEEDGYVVSKVGELPDAIPNGANVTGTTVGEIAWNPVKQEIAVFARATTTVDEFDRASLYRFRKVGTEWDADEINLKVEKTGEFAEANGISPPWSSGLSAQAITTMGRLTVTRTGSYLFASGTTTYRKPNPDNPATNVQVPLNAAEIIVDGDEPTIRFVDGTALGPHAGFGTRYGWGGVARSHDGSSFIHNSSWGQEVFIRLDIVDGVIETVGDTFKADYDIQPPAGVAGLGATITPDPFHGLDWITDTSDPNGYGFHALRRVNGVETLISSHKLDDNPPPNWGLWRIVTNPATGDIYVPVLDEPTGRFAYQRFTVDGYIAAPDEQPEDTVVSLDVGEASRTVEFRSTVAGGDPVPGRQWQVRAPGDSRFTDIEGETGETLEVSATRNLDGFEFRAVYVSAAGEFPSDVATLSVFAVPLVVNDIVDTAVVAGENANFSVMPQGNPAPEITWQRQVGGFWQNIDLDLGDFEVGGEAGGFLVVKDTNVAMDGSKFRARLRNKITPGSDEWSTVYSRVATLSVAAPSTTPVHFSGGSVDWGFANRWRCYITGQIARGQITPSGGAIAIEGAPLATGGLCSGTNSATGLPWGTGSEPIRFPVESGRFDPVTGEVEIELQGQVRFWGHAWHVPGDTTPLLDTTVSDLRIRIDGDGNGAVVADAVGASMDNPEPAIHDDIELVGFDAAGLNFAPSDGEVDLSGIPTALTAAGSPVFGEYPEHEPFDPLSLSLVAGSAPVADPEITLVPAVKLKANTRIARITCPADGGPCLVKAPAKLKLKVSGKLTKAQKKQLRKGARVSTSRNLGPGSSAGLTITLTNAQRKALKGKKLRGSLKVTVTGNGGSDVTRTLKVAAKAG